MSVLRRVNLLSEQRVDIPDLRSIESAVSGDFDNLAQSFFTGTSQGYILRGFNILMASAIGGAASSLQVQVDPGAIFHVTSNQSGTFYLVPSGTPAQTLNSATNTLVNGAFTPNAINYISLEYTRMTDKTTEAQTYFWDPVQDTETTMVTPRAVVLNYTLNISVTVPASNYLPIAVVVTDASNNVLEVTDARWLMFRLGAGGYSPNPFYQFSWTQGQSENVSSSTADNVDPFSGGDKSIGTLKDWMNAVMTAIQEVKGTPYWYSQNSSGSLETLREDLGNTVITGKGSIAQGVLPSDGTTVTAPGQVNWDADIYVRIVGSEIAYDILANPTSADITLQDNQVAFINLVRNIPVAPNLIWTNGSSVVLSVGGVSWTAPLQPGDWIKLAFDPSSSFYQIASVDSLTQVTLTTAFDEASTGISGLQSVYSFGSYQAVAVPSTNRHIQIADRGSVPQNGDVFWFLLRSDNGGAPRVYVRFLSAELTQGASQDISGETPIELLQYIGSNSTTQYAPQYVATQSTDALPEIQTITVGTGAQMPNNGYFNLYSSNDARSYYVWVNQSGQGIDPQVSGKNASIEVALNSSMTAAQVALAFQNAINACVPTDFTAAQSTTNTSQVLITNNSAGACTAGYNQSLGSSFTIVETQKGVGEGNNFINDGDSLTLAIKKLDSTIAAIVANTNNPSYEEPLAVISGTAVNTNQVTGPIAAGTSLVLPENSRNGSIQQKYTTGQGNLILALNGQVLTANPGIATATALVSYAMATSSIQGTSQLNAQATKYAVAFVPSETVQATAVKFRVAPTGALTGNFYSSIYTGSGIPTAAVAASNLVPASPIVDVSTLTFSFNNPVTLTVGTTYWFSLEGDATYLAGSAYAAMQSLTGATQTYPLASFSGGAWLAVQGATPAFEVECMVSSGPYDWTEVGEAGTNQASFIINQNLVVGDVLTCRIISGAVAPAGGSGGAGGAISQGAPGPQGPAGQDALYAMAISTKTANYNVQSSDNVLLANCTTGNIIFTLPSASAAVGRVYVFKKIDPSANQLTITTTSGQLIDGSTTQAVTLQYESLTVVTDGNAWYLM